MKKLSEVIDNLNDNVGLIQLDQDVIDMFEEEFQRRQNQNNQDLDDAFRSIFNDLGDAGVFLSALTPYLYDTVANSSFYSQMSWVDGLALWRESAARLLQESRITRRYAIAMNSTYVKTRNRKKNLKK